MNIKELLSNAPRPVTLYTPCFGFVTYDPKKQDGYPVNAIKTEMSSVYVTFTEDGKLYETREHDGAECMLFPDDFERSWNSWAPHLVANGDWVVLNNGAVCQFDDEKHKFADVQRWANSGEIEAMSNSSPEPQPEPEPEPEPEERKERAAEKRVVLFDDVAVFDHVLFRDEDTDNWLASFISDYKAKDFAPYKEVGGTGWRQCIPYAGNEHLRGTTTSPKTK